MVLGHLVHCLDPLLACCLYYLQHWRHYSHLLSYYWQFLHSKQANAKKKLIIVLQEISLYLASLTAITWIQTINVHTCKKIVNTSLAVCLPQCISSQ